MKLNTRMALHLIVIIAASLVWPVTGYAASSELSLAINKAGRQRMLSQRIVKAYSQVALKVNTDASAEELRVAVDVFDDQLVYLKEQSPSSEITAGLERLEKLWTPFKQVALDDPTKAGAENLMKQDSELLFAANDVVKLLVAHSGASAAEITNISGRQRMLSQRLAKFYMLKTLGVKDASINSGIEQATTEFTATQIRLKGNKANTRYIKTELARVDKRWRRMNTAVRSRQPQPLVVASTAEKILSSMNEVTSMYAALASVRVSRR